MSKPPPPPPTRFGPSGAQAQTAQAKGAGYKLVVGAYMHQNQARLPQELAGHGFVAIESPDGRRQAFGFSPANFSAYDPRRDLGKLTAGVQGKVHADGGAFAKPGVRTQSVPIDEGQARAALAKVSEYRTGRHQFSASRCQCTTFATDVAKAAGVDLGPGNRNPRTFYESLRKR